MIESAASSEEVCDSRLSTSHVLSVTILMRLRMNRVILMFFEVKTTSVTLSRILVTLKKHLLRSDVNRSDHCLNLNFSQIHIYGGIQFHLRLKLYLNLIYIYALFNYKITIFVFFKPSNFIKFLLDLVYNLIFR